MAKIVLHKKIPTTHDVVAGETHAFTFVMKDGTSTALALTAPHVFDATSLDNYAVGRHNLRVFIADPNAPENKILAAELPVYISPGLTAEISKNTEILNAINAVLTGKATDDLQSYTLAGRSVTKMPVADLERLQAKYTEMVKAENAGYLDVAPATARRFKNINFTFTQNYGI